MEFKKEWIYKFRKLVKGIRKNVRNLGKEGRDL